MKLYAMLLLSVIISCPLKFDGNHLYQGYGYVFNEKHTPSFKINDWKFGYALSGCDIITTENIFFDQFYEYMSNNENVNWDEIPENPKLYYWKYNRQYLGYINKGLDTIVILNLLNFNRTRKAKRQFVGWDEFFFTGLGGFYEKNQILFKVNLSKNEFSLF